MSIHNSVRNQINGDQRTMPDPVRESISKNSIERILSSKEVGKIHIMRNYVDFLLLYQLQKGAWGSQVS
jgi:hypothetical protein